MVTRLNPVVAYLTDEQLSQLKEAAGSESLSTYITRCLGFEPTRRGRPVGRAGASGNARREVGVTTAEHQGAPPLFTQSRTTVSGQTSTFDDAAPRLPGQSVRLDVDYSDEYSQ
jgi:hypothetical protein